MVRKRWIIRLEGGVGPPKCGMCFRPPTLVLHRNYDSFDARGRSVLASGRSYYCEECGRKIGKRYGVAVPEVQRACA